MRVLYFIENNWVFGKIFNELIKFLHPDIDGDILGWDQLYHDDEMLLLREKYDLYFSTPVGCFFLHDHYGWPLEKCYAHAHSEFDIRNALDRYPPEYFDRLAGYAVVSPYIWQKAVAIVNRPPSVLPVGITVANYSRPPSKGLLTLGYFGRMSRSDYDGEPDIKRGYLAERVARETGLAFYARENVHFLAADQLYKHVDMVMFCSTTEGNPYVALEAAAAGVPVLGTEVGVFPALAAHGAGVVLPFDEDEFVSAACTVIERMDAEPDLYFYMSAMAKDASRAFDWSAITPLWVDEFCRVARTDALTRKDSHDTTAKEKTGDQAHLDPAHQTTD